MPPLLTVTTAPNTIPATVVKIIIPVASLKKDSNSTMVESNQGTFSILKVLMTIAASVGEINAANKKAS
jgi:hypothetical protein